MSVRKYICLAAIAFAASPHAARATALRGPCDDSLTQGIPTRAADAPGGHAFAEVIRGLSDDERESRIQHELLAGNIPKFLRALVPIRLRSTAGNGAPVDIVICAAPDYLTIGSDDDFLLMPMRLSTALSTAASFGFTLPTPRMVDAIYAQAAVHFVPQPLPAGSEMRSTEYSVRHNEMVGYGSRASWNLRDSHMFETLKNLLTFHGPQSKGIVWAHNSHVGDSAATEMSARDEYNIGHLCRHEFGDVCYSVGFGTNSGTVAAASNWDEPMQVKSIRPGLAGSYEHLCHETGDPRFLLPLRGVGPTAPLAGLLQPRLERAIGVIYRPETELQSHYFEAVLPRQFDEFVWFDETSAVTPLRSEELKGLPDTYPFGL